jgi:signal transduction histidine kinase
VGIGLASRSATSGAPLSVTEIGHRERVLAAARSLAALCAIIALHFDPSLPGHHTLTGHLLLLLYFIHSSSILCLLGFDPDCGSNFLLWVHSADIFWPALISLYTNGPNSPFSALFAVGLVGAAYRWGLRETLGTALASVLIFLSEAAFVTSRWGREFHLLHGEFHFSAFILEIIGILFLGSLLGHLAEREKKFRTEAVAIKRIVQKAGSEAGVNETVEDTLSSILRLFGAGRVVLALRSQAAGGGVMWEIEREPGGQNASRFAELSMAEVARYFFPVPGRSWRLQKSRRGNSYKILTLDAEGRYLEQVTWPLPAVLFSEKPFQTLLAAAFTAGNEWWGRVFLFDSRNSSRLSAELRFFQEVVREAVPAMHGAYLLRRSRSRIRAAERARVARDLHDGVIQSLISLEMQVDGLRRQAAGVSNEAAEKLGSVGRLLREEVINLRELTQQLKRDDSPPQKLPACIAEMASQFQRETGICAQFLSEWDGTPISTHVSREVAQIVREALTNVRKHSAARNVSVHLAPDDGICKLVIQDDGRGFEFSGRLTQADLDHARKGPQVIKERVRSIRGELAIVSLPSQGARLEIRFDPKVNG